jgi:hypothetical protein
VEAYVLGLTDGGITCMGGAVALALEALEESGRRHIILFSDGMQNCNPVLVEEGAFVQILHVDPGDVSDYDFVTQILGDSGIAPRPGIDLEDFDTHIHTIGVGLSGVPWTDLMSEIAFETDGLHFETPAPEVDLQNFYVNDLLESFTGATPQLVQHSHGTLSPEQAHRQDACWINSTPRWLTVVLSWQGNPDHNRLCCNLEAPDGTLIDIDSRTQVSPRRRVISMPLPTFHRDRLVSQAGQWRLHISGTTDGVVPYQVFWIVDDHHVRFEVTKFERAFYVGESLALRAKILQDGEPLPGTRIQEAVLYMASPMTDLGKFIQDYRIKPNVLQQLKEKREVLSLGSEMELKLYALSQDKDAVAHVTKMQARTLPMNYERADLVSEVKLVRPGMHHFHLQVMALDRQGYPITRTRTLHAWVRADKRAEQGGNVSLIL